jgi:hypothetical protein
MGVSVGVTPPMNQLQLPPGRYTIVVRNGDAPAFEQTVAVQDGKPLQLHHQF